MYINGVYNLLKADSLSFFFLIWKELNTFSSLPKGKQQCAQKERQVICQLLQHVHHLVDMLCILKGGDLSCYCIFSAHVIKCQSQRMFSTYVELQSAPSNLQLTCPSPCQALGRRQPFCTTRLLVSLLLFCAGVKTGFSLHSQLN